ncbi:MAG: glucuronate isomerase [Mucilaginibacter polytrichastri]|nr:glucuronate isomerase [Mucilaginibacter polytrichastri]
MKPFLDDDFLLNTETAKQLYHEYAAQMPIIDYHCHLPPQDIALNRQFENLSQIWLAGDHYKWRAMRINGVDESYCTGNRSDREKFTKWAETVPYTVRNPLYHWTHLELQRYFGITDLLSPKTADRIYDECSEKLNTPEYSVQALLRKFGVKTVCTTDDPLDDLSYHRQIAANDSGTRVIPAFRPDKAMQTDDLEALNTWIDRLGELTGIDIDSFDRYLEALRDRHDFFAENGCQVSDHGVEHLYAADFTDSQVAEIFQKLRVKTALPAEDIAKFKSAMLYYFAIWDHEKGWVQQYHVGALRNNNSRLLATLGPDTGWDSIGDFQQGRQLSRFLDRLDRSDQLAKTIIYNLNPADNALIASMTGNFNDGSVAGKIQFGSGWWFLDQKNGMTEQMNALSNMGLLSRFVGMLTDSRSFMSFPRHEYFRRILCNLFGDDVHNGELPADLPLLGQIVQDICYNNAQKYFGFGSEPVSPLKNQNTFA